jgi:hypothetical protein
MATRQTLSSVEIRGISDAIKHALARKTEPLDAALANVVARLDELADRIALIERAQNQPWVFSLERDANMLLTQIVARPGG